MRPLARPWTPEEDERLKEFVARGASDIRVAAAFKRKKGSVRERARRLGCPFPTLAAARKKWADTPNNEWRKRR
jgi:GcrA cell cycle regulator